MRQTRMLARELGVVGLINVQFAIFEGEVYILEVNPRASRTIPFVSKAIGVPLAKLAARVMAGKTLAELGFTTERVPHHVSVKESVFPVRALPRRRYHSRSRDEIDRRSDGHRRDVRDGVRQGRAGRVDRSAARGHVFISVRDEDKRAARADRARSDRDGFRAGRHRAAPRAIIQRLGIRMRRRQQGRAGQSARGRSDAGGQDRDGDQHAGRGGDRGLILDPPHRAGVAAAVLHHDGGSAGRGRSDRGAEGCEPLDVRALQDYHRGSQSDIAPPSGHRKAAADKPASRHGA